MSPSASIGELKVMVENLTKNLEEHTERSTDFYREIKEELKDIKRVVDSKAPIDSLMRLEDKFELHKKETSNQVNSMAVKVGVGTGVIMTLATFAKLLIK